MKDHHVVTAPFLLSSLSPLMDPLSSLLAVTSLLVLCHGRPLDLNRSVVAPLPPLSLPHSSTTSAPLLTSRGLNNKDKERNSLLCG
ncbi:unnamed protein product [Camellia sinensis]